MLPKRKLAAYYQYKACTYANAATDAREHYTHMLQAPKWIGWLFANDWSRVYLDNWEWYSILAEANALTARYLMGVEE